MTRILIRYFVGLLFVVSFSLWGGSVALSAQTGRGSSQGRGGVSGVLKDPNGVVITGLDASTQVSLKNLKTGSVYNAPVAVNGSYSISNLPPGEYDLQLPIRSAMYQSFEQKNVQIVADQTLKLDLPIKWGMNLGTIGDDPVLLSNDLLRRSKYVDGPAPRTTDGHPDFSGEWDLIVDAKDLVGLNQVPMKPWAKAIYDKLQAAMEPPRNGNPGIQGPGVYCLPYDATPDTYPFPFEVIQTPTRLVELIEFDTPGFREIYLDGRKHPDSDVWNPAWYGHSVGHWEGDTLVVDIVGFNAYTPAYGIHTEALHVIERIRRPSKGRLELDITATDPKAWTGTYHRHLEEGLVTGDELQEWVCSENNETSHFGKETWLELMRQLMATAPPSALGDDGASQTAVGSIPQH